MRSSEVPSSVDKLRPGDIDIVGAIGDSLTAGNGAMATNLLEVIVESKGLSWCNGGQDVNILTQLKGKPRRCEVLHLLECPCFLGARFAGQRQRFVQIIERWNALQANIANREEFHTKSDFGVVWQPCLANISFPTTQNGDSDFSYMSYDCFHLSQKGYARAANGLWNNMMEPVGQKAHDWVDEFSVFKCPTPEMPFIRTRGNSNTK
ncbi:hypothetical protein quinque_003389 [Culex quinquefasciatus]